MLHIFHTSPTLRFGDAYKVLIGERADTFAAIDTIENTARSQGVPVQRFERGSSFEKLVLLADTAKDYQVLVPAVDRFIRTLPEPDRNMARYRFIKTFEDQAKSIEVY